MKKLRIEELQVDSFTAGETPNELRGTVRANASGLPCDLTYNGCPTQYCVTYPLNTCGAG
ncbi:MAG TPA: hypothetical protein VFS20_00390 [Longimicrobium sp.]|nr:hypothetical protein [Longimicrobium sp.]